MMVLLLTKHISWRLLINLYAKICSVRLLNPYTSFVSFCLSILILSTLRERNLN